MDEQKYEILYEESAHALENAVNKEIAEGWRPQGGVSVVTHSWENDRKGYTEREWLWSQAMVRD